MLFLHSMEQETFSTLLGRALDRVASEHGQHYPEGGAKAWGVVGASYLGFALYGLTSVQLRSIQYRTRQDFGPVILDCKWYDRLKAECLDNRESADVLIPGPDEKQCRCSVTEQLFLEMLDFCREG